MGLPIWERMEINRKTRKRLYDEAVARGYSQPGYQQALNQAKLQTEQAKGGYYQAQAQKALRPPGAGAAGQSSRLRDLLAARKAGVESEYMATYGMTPSKGGGYGRAPMSYQLPGGGKKGAAPYPPGVLSQLAKQGRIWDPAQKKFVELQETQYQIRARDAKERLVRMRGQMNMASRQALGPGEVMRMATQLDMGMDQIAADTQKAIAALDGIDFKDPAEREKAARGLEERAAQRMKLLVQRRDELMKFSKPRLPQPPARPAPAQSVDGFVGAGGGQWVPAQQPAGPVAPAQPVDADAAASMAFESLLPSLGQTFDFAGGKNQAVDFADTNDLPPEVRVKLYRMVKKYFEDVAANPTPSLDWDK